MCNEKQQFIRFTLEGEQIAIAWDTVAIVVHSNGTVKDGVVELGTENYKISLKYQPVTITVMASWLDEESKNFLQGVVLGETQLQQ